MMIRKEGFIVLFLRGKSSILEGFIVELLAYYIYQQLPVQWDICR